MSRALVAAELRRSLRSRSAALGAILLAYAALALPFLLARPPAHVRAAAASWFGAGDAFALFLYLWTDVAMNKTVVVLGVALAGSTLVRERDARELPLLLSKPVTAPRLFAVRVAGACAALAVPYVGAHLLALAVAAPKVAGFRPGAFLASMLVHLGAALFAVTFSATVSVVAGRRGLALLASLLCLLTLVGAAFAGFYNPAWARWSWLNPFALGAQVLAHLGDLRAAHVAVPAAALAAINLATVAVGARAARRFEEA